MPDARSTLLSRLQEAFDTVQAGADPVLRDSDRADYQANGALALGKALGRNPREIATEVVAAANLDDLCSEVEISGPGFLNLTLSTDFVAAQVGEVLSDPRLGIAPSLVPEKVVVDYSSPNVAKEMHVGHLRTTVIGDALCRMLTFVGHTVIRENHVGDWGTPFGMLIEHLVDLGEDVGAHELSVGDLNGFYQQARTSFTASEAFQERSRARVVALQSGDPETLRLWRILVDESVAYFDEVYAKLDVMLTDDDIVGESFYNPLLQEVVDFLDSIGLLVENEGAECVFPPGFTNRENEPLPLIVRKSDGGFGYAATDLAAIQDRVERLGANRILVVVGTPQTQHLAMCFEVGEMAGWLGEHAQAIHVAFGNVLGPDRKVLRSREGEAVKLVALLDEAVERAGMALADRESDMDQAERDRVAQMVGIGAVKYADLSTERLRDYVFDWERMLAAEGNTGPYLQYANARIRSIFRRGGVEPPKPGAPPTLEAPEERALALHLLGFNDAFQIALETYSPSKLCAYLFDLAQTFTSFYEGCKVLVDVEETRRSRLLLCELTAQVLAQGLSLLGIDAPERM